MAYLLGYRSAVEWLRSNRDASLLLQYWALPMLSLEGSRARLQRHLKEFASLARPLHLVIALREGRRPSAETVCHLLTSPDGTYPGIRIGRGAFCSTPAFTFLQMANILDEVTLRFLGMELCGRYGIGHDGKLFLRPQSCTPAELEGMTHTMTGVRGRKRAGKVAEIVAGGSASPMETALFLILCAAREEGGFGLPWPELNHSIPLTGAARDLWDDDFIMPDLLWEAAKLIVEYDSDLHHTASHRIARDARRRNVFEEMGYRVVTVTAEHMRTPQELQRIASIVARSTGTELETPTDEQWTQMVSWQLLVRDLAENPGRLLGPEQAAPNKRTWHSRRPQGSTTSK